MGRCALCASEAIWWAVGVPLCGPHGALAALRGRRVDPLEAHVSGTFGGAEFVAVTQLQRAS